MGFDGLDGPLHPVLPERKGFLPRQGEHRERATWEGVRKGPVVVQPHGHPHADVPGTAPSPVPGCEVLETTLCFAGLAAQTRACQVLSTFQLTAKGLILTGVLLGHRVSIHSAPSGMRT